MCEKGYEKESINETIKRRIGAISTRICDDVLSIKEAFVTFNLLLLMKRKEKMCTGGYQQKIIRL